MLLFKKLKYLYAGVIISSMTFLSSGCKDTINQQDIDSREIPSQGVSYTLHIQPVLDLKCNYSGCHDDGSRAGGLSFTTYINTTSDLSLVLPGEPQNSRLVWSIEGISGGLPMPPIGYPPMTKNQILGVRTWIKEGAKNN